MGNAFRASLGYFEPIGREQTFSSMSNSSLSYGNCGGHKIGHKLLAQQKSRAKEKK